VAWIATYILGYLLLAVLQAIALARYPHQFHRESVPAIVYLIFLGVMVLTGAVGPPEGCRAPSGRARFPRPVQPSNSAEITHATSAPGS